MNNKKRRRWESNPPGGLLTLHNGFEDRAAHQQPIYLHIHSYVIILAWFYMGVKYNCWNYVYNYTYFPGSFLEKPVKSEARLYIHIHLSMAAQFFSVPPQINTSVKTFVLISLHILQLSGSHKIFLFYLPP